MKQWILPFRKSLFSKNLACTLMAGLALSCQNMGESQGPVLHAQAPDFSASVKVYLQSGQNTPTYVGEFDRNSCENDSPTHWALFVNSPLGDSRVDLDMTAALKSKGPIGVRVWSQSFNVDQASTHSLLAEAKLCEKAKGEASITLNTQSPEARELLSTLGNLAPDCLMTIKGEKGLNCELKHKSMSELLSSLEASKRNMSTKWNHQPYLLIRRLTLSQQLLSALESERSIRDTRRFCRIITHSLPNELPLSFQSKLWQDRVCNQSALDRDMALVGLDLALREIEALSRRIEDASYVGVFTLSLPPHPNAAKDYWITLQPVTDPNLRTENPLLSVNCLWHPLFATRLDQQLIASEFTLNAPIASHCQKTEELLQNKKLADSYLRSSTASEMEFEISNRQSKKLRLPTGDYQYTITQHNGLSIDETAAAEALVPLSTGSISWKKGNSHTIIRNW